MSDRPTPEQIADERYPHFSNEYLSRLRDAGYVVVHPDDHPPTGPEVEYGTRDEWRTGYNEALDAVFGGGS